MKGDFTKLHIHNPPKHYTGVLKQQGRVDLDADSNEAHEIAEYLRHTLTRDVIGPCGFPRIGGGFNAIGRFFADRGFVVKLDDATGDRIEADLAISPGRGYVDGILCELEATPVLIDEVLTGDDADVRVRLPSLVVDGRELRRGQAVEFLVFREESRVPQVISPPVRIIDADLAERTLAFREDIGQLARRASGLRRVTTYTTQPNYPDPPELGLDELLDGDFDNFEFQRTDLVYLDVWQRHVTAFEDPDILEVALGGPDTTTRVKTVWQVKVMKDVRASGCGDEIEGWPPPPSGGRLSTEVVATPAAEDPCLIAPGGGYRGLENRLYRVEVHREGDLDEATFKWSRDNGSVVFPVEEFESGRQVKVRRLGRDQVLRLRMDDWVEVLDDDTEYRQDHTGDGAFAGTMARIVGIDDEDRVLTLDRDLPAGAYDIARHARVRRWDQTQNVDADGLTTTAAGPTLLEDGIQVRFSGNDFKAGDYWVFAARTATGDAERLTDAPPLGIKHHYCRLAMIEWNIALERGEDRVIANVEARSEDCRPTFPPLTEITAGAPTDIGADDVSFDDGVCEMGADTVQEALDALCRRPTKVDDWPTVVDIGWANDMPLPLERFNRGLEVRFSESINPATLSLDTFIVTLELAEEDPVAGFPGHRPFIVRGIVERDDSRALFRPEPNIADDILQTWLRLEAQFVEIPRLRCRVVLKGNAILDERTGERPLDGDVFGRLRDDKDRVTEQPTTDLIFPSGDGNKGGDFESWFYLSREE